MAGADTLANQLIDSLTDEADFEIPKIDLTGPEWQFPGGSTGPIYDVVKPLKEIDLTSRTVGGTGLFDGLMAAYNSQIAQQFEKGRITGDDYTKAYIALSNSALGNAVQFLLGKDQAFWAAQMAQTQAITARVQLEIAKVGLQTARLEALNQRAVFALTKLKLASESINYDTAAYNLANLLPKQGLQLDAETAVTTTRKAGMEIENSAATYNLSNILPATLSKLNAEVLGQGTANQTAAYNLANMLPAQLLMVGQQRLLLSEQTEAQRGQTADVRTDGALVTGVLGKQKNLYDQQIDSYKRDADAKMVKIFSDAWITQKTIDEGLLPPTQFTNGPIDTMLAAFKTRNGF